MWLKHPAKPKSKETTARKLQLHNIHERLQSARNALAPCLANLLLTVSWGLYLQVLCEETTLQVFSNSQMTSLKNDPSRQKSKLCGS